MFPLRSTLTVFNKEIREILRDRRTLALAVLVPLLLVPVMSIIGAWVGLQVEPKVSSDHLTVVLNTHANLNDLPALISNDEKLTIQWVNDVTLVEKPISNGDAELGITLVDNVEQPQTLALEIIYPRLASHHQREDVRQLIDKINDLARASGIKQLNISNEQRDLLLYPLQVTERSLAVENDARNIFGASLGAFALMLLLIYGITGSSMYAFDLTVGEKDRGTLETLLMVPQERLALVLGKLLAILNVSVITAISGVAGIALAIIASSSLGGEQQSTDATITAFYSFVDSISFLDVLVMSAYFLPILISLCALLMMIGIYSRSEREAKAFIMPLMALIVLPVAVSQGSLDEFPLGFMFIPFLNDVFGLRGHFNGLAGSAWLPVTTIVNLITAAITITLCCAMFRRESVLMRA